MAHLETIFVWITIGCYALISGLYVYGFIFRNEKLMDRLPPLLLAALAIETGAIADRFRVLGNLPVAGDYENGLSMSWMVVAFTVYVSWKQPRLRAIGLGSIPFALLMLGYGTMRTPQLLPMAVSLKSAWLYVHVFFAWLAFGGYALSFSTALVYLLKERKVANDSSEEKVDFARLDEYMFKYAFFGFITHAVMIASGAIWAKDLWGNYWSWDPVETWSLVSWLVYGLAIHLRVTFGWRGRRLAWIFLFALSGITITGFGINFFVDTSLHVFKAK